MNYFRIKDFNNEDYEPQECRIYKSTQPVKKGDVVIVESGYGNYPITAEVVVPKVDEIKALTVRYEIEEVIAIVDMSEYNLKREKKLQKEILANRLKEKMDEVKLVENFKKFSEKDDEMRELFRQFQTLTPSNSDTEFD